HLPITDVAQAEFSAGDEVEGRITSYHSYAVPVLSRNEAPVQGKEGLPGPHARTGVGSGVRRAVLVGGGHGAGGERDERGPGRKQGGSGGGDQHAFLLIPASDAGKSFGEHAK